MAQLPASSRLARAMNPGSELYDERVYLARIEYWQHVLIWALGKRSRRGKAPRLLVPETAAPVGHGAETRHIKGEARPLDEIRAMFPIRQKTE